MYARVLLQYDRGAVRHDKPRAPILGQVESITVNGALVLQLWPHDFAMNTRYGARARPLHELWHAQLSVVLTAEFAVMGMERLREAGGRSRWVAQRWVCEPMSLARIQQELDGAKQSTGVLTPARG